MMINITEANKKVVQAFMEARPVVVGTALAINVIPGMHKDLFLHAGPPITWERMSGPIKGAMVGALIFEGRAKTAEEAYKILESGQIKFAPCHDHSAVGPMAGGILPPVGGRSGGNTP